VHVVERGHFRSREKYGSYTIRSTIAQNLIQIHTNFMAPSVMVMVDRPFLFLWPWSWPDVLHIRTWVVFSEDVPDVEIWTSYVKAFNSYRLTDSAKLYITSLRGWSKQREMDRCYQVVMKEDGNRSNRQSCMKTSSLVCGLCFKA